MELAEEISFPEETIQCIQSFLNSKEAAQTTLVSKSWYTAWLTRPNLHFDQQHFDSDGADFWKFVNNTLRRYHKLNLTIHSLKLWILQHQHSDDLVNNLIITALKMGATDLDFKIDPPNLEFALPHQVFEFQDLSRLSVSGCKIDDKIEVIRCSRLKSLVLEGVFIRHKNNNLVWDIISCCPSIENFSFFRAFPPLCPELHFLFESQHFGLPNAFHNLKCLSLYLVLFDYAYFRDFSSKFPCLEDLAFHNCTGSLRQDVMKISSPSLQRITYTLDAYSKIRLEFDVPRIRKFTFSGPSIPFLSFKSSSRNWESDISILCEDPPDSGWFLLLRELLKDLSLSQISLSLKFMSDKIYVCEGDFLDVPDKPQVENLTVMEPQALEDSGVVNSLFQCCCPIYVSQYAFPKKCKQLKRKRKQVKRKGKKCSRYEDEEEDEEQYDFSKMIQQVSLNSCIAYQKMTEEGEKSDLEEVGMEFYDESVSAWRPAIVSAADQHMRIRLHLRWGRRLPPSSKFCFFKDMSFHYY